MANNVTVQVQGLKVKNSPFEFDTCRGVLVSGLSISSPTLCPHTDGIHVENAQDVLISNTAVSNSDDCVSPSAPAPSTCTPRTSPPCGPVAGHGMSIGSLGKQGTRACVANGELRGDLALGQRRPDQDVEGQLRLRLRLLLLREHAHGRRAQPHHHRPV